EFVLIHWSAPSLLMNARLIYPCCGVVTPRWLSLSAESGGSERFAVVWQAARVPSREQRLAAPHARQPRPTSSRPRRVAPCSHPSSTTRNGLGANAPQLAHRRRGGRPSAPQ